MQVSEKELICFFICDIKMSLDVWEYCPICLTCGILYGCFKARNYMENSDDL